MNFFLNGDFKIQESWEKKSNQSRNSKSRERPPSSKNNNSALYNAGKNLLQPSTDIIDDQISKRILRQFAAQIPPPPSSTKSLKKIPGTQLDKNKKLPPKQKVVYNNEDNNLLTSMASKLKQMQITCKSQREQLKEKSQLIQSLRTQNQFYKGLKNDSAKIFEQMQTIKSQNTSLHKKIQQMESYLKKYGVKWVGYNVQGKLDHQSLKNDIKKPKFNYRLPAEIDIGTIQRRVQELNGGLHSQGMGTQVYNQNGIHKFRKAQPLPMAFFGNGIAIKGFKFFPYKSKESLQILSDLVDGYFPYVLKHKYPNGIFLSVIDNIAQKYQQSNQKTDNIANMESIQNNAFKPPSKQQFLNNLPKQIIKNGKVIQIRGQIQKRLNGQAAQTIPQQEDQNLQYEQVEGMTVFLTQQYQKIKNENIKQDQICTLKIRTEEGKVCVLHLEKNKLVKDIYNWMSKIVKTKFTIMGNYPRRSYQEGQAQNLQELGLFPNAMLHVHLKKV